MNFSHDDLHHDDFEADAPTVTAGSPGKLTRLIRRRRKRVILTGRDDKRKPLERVDAQAEPNAFELFFFRDDEGGGP